MSRLGFVAASLAVAALTVGCSSDSEEPEDVPSGPEPVTFTADIHPILRLKCGSSDCHDGEQAPTLPGHGAEDVQEAYDATQATSFIGGRVYERILSRVSTTEPGLMMPPSYANPPCSGVVGAPGCITEAELALIQEWIAQGTPLL
jgi:hypothetical protein